MTDHTKTSHGTEPAPQPGRRVVDYDAIKSVSSEVRLLEISTVGFSAHSSRPLAGLRASDLEQTVRYRAQRQHTDPDVMLSMVEVDYVASLDGAVVAGVTGTFAALYATGSAAAAADAALLDTLAEVNGIYNTWPYMRELVSSCLARLGLTGTLLPVWLPPDTLPPKGEFARMETGRPDEE